MTALSKLSSRASRLRSPRRLLAVTVVAAVALLGAACSSHDPDTTPAAGGTASQSGATGGTAGATGSNSSSASGAPALAYDATLAAQLPASVRSSKKLVSVNTGSFPPYTIVQTGQPTIGASDDLLRALGQLWGITITEQTVAGLSGQIAGVASGRYDLAFGPVGDFKKRETGNVFVDYVREFVVFAVPKGNPNHITGLDSTCGLKIAVQAGGSAEDVIKGQAAACTKAGEKPVQVLSFADQPSSVLAVQSGRADAFFSSRAPLTYFVQQSHGALELAGLNQKNGFVDLYQGAMVKKGSPLEPALQSGIQKLIDNGTYARVMDKWGLQANRIPKVGINLAQS